LAHNFSGFLGTLGNGGAFYSYRIIDKTHVAEESKPHVNKDTQTNHDKLFESLADLTNEDGPLVEMQDLGNLSDWLVGDVNEEPEIVPPTGENLLDDESREKLPPLYIGKEEGLDTLAQVKFFTPNAQWTWNASEFDG
jgi:hypothetical protein